MNYRKDWDGITTVAWNYCNKFGIYRDIQTASSQAIDVITDLTILPILLNLVKEYSIS